jgi:hypothetical protein
MGLYYVIQNLPPEENSRLRSIHVAAYAYCNDFDPNQGIDTILDPFFDELKQLECEEGVLIDLKGEPYTLRATLIAVPSDGEAAHEFTGLLAAGSNLFCRSCMVHRKEMHQNILAIGDERTPALHLQHLHEVQAEGVAAQKRTGVQRDCKLRTNCKYARVPEIATFDGMHDILKGIAPMEIKLALIAFRKKKFITVDCLNARIKSFQYGFQDVKNKPSANLSDKGLSVENGYGLHQSAAQTWCFLRVFAFLVRPDVPEDDPHLRLISLLKMMSEIIFSTSVSESDLLRLRALTKEHHELFFQLYPPTQQADMEEEQEIEDEAAVDDVDVQEENVPEQEIQNTRGRRPKKPKKIRPINKHHHVLHYEKMIRKFGSAVLYWCMRCVKYFLLFFSQWHALLIMIYSTSNHKL